MKKILDDITKSYGLNDSLSRIQNWHEEALKAARGFDVAEIMEQHLNILGNYKDTISSMLENSLKVTLILRC